MNDVLVIGHFYEEGFASHIKDTLFDNDIRVSSVDMRFNIKWPTNKKYLSKFNGTIQQLAEKTKIYEKYFLNIILNTIDKKFIKLIIVCHDFLTPLQIKEIKRGRDIKIVMWFPDPIGQIHRGMFMNADYDILFFKDNHICKILKNELNLNTEYLPECCNPKYHNFVDISESENIKYGCDITTAGNLPTNRILLFEELAKILKYDIKIWGNEPPSWSDTTRINKFIQHQFVANTEKSKAFRAAKIVLNNLRISEVSGTNVRTFEIAACGGFQITTYRDGIYDLYNQDEIVTYRSFNDLIDKIEFYLVNPDLRLKISNKAFTRTHLEHTYKKRLETMTKKIYSN